MAEITNRPTITDPRSGGANQTFYGLTGDAARQAELNKLIFEQHEKYILLFNYFTLNFNSVLHNRH